MEDMEECTLAWVFLLVYLVSECILPTLDTVLGEMEF